MDLVFFITVFDEWRDGEAQIKRIQQLYPGTAIITVTDGTFDETYATFCQQQPNVTYSQGDRLKLMASGGAWTERMLAKFLASEHETLIKIDPGDTRLNFPLTSVPRADLFGNLREAGGRTHVQGGCIGLSRAGASKILASNLLGSPQFTTRAYAYPPSAPPYNKQRKPLARSVDPITRTRQPQRSPEPEWLTVEDVILYEIAQALHLSIAEFDQIYCHYLDCPADARRQYAITHPEKLEYT